ncbi:MAG: folate-binding protein YgfZ [Caldilineaceae bacterium]|nr:folate-binding protein YgfZ [Caldilineaceae bacterium]
MTHTGGLEIGKEHMPQGACLLPDRGPRVLWMSGDDSEDFLQRMTTNDMRLPVGGHRPTALLTGTGRIQAVFSVIRDDEGYWLIAPPHGSEALGSMLQGNIFFMDQVTVEDVSDQWDFLYLVGHGASAVVELLEFATPVPAMVARAGDRLCLHENLLELPGFGLLIPAPETDGVRRAVQQSHGTLWSDWDEYDDLRIRSVRGGYGYEYTEAFNPLEVGLDAICSDNKGCYPGQEVIARQLNYDRVARGLVLLESEQPLSTGDPVKLEGRPLGEVTSVGSVSADHTWPSLAVVRSRQLAPGQTVMAGDRPAVVAAMRQASLV